MFINYKHLWCTILWAHMLGGAVETYVQHLCLCLCFQWTIFYC